jgi:hypothetical protein
MSNEGNCDKRLIHLRVALETCRAVEKKYRQPEDESKSDAFIRALEDATRRVTLTAEDYELILAERRKNEAARQSKREVEQRRKSGRAAR